jgi:hypothetical protein
MKNKQEEPEAEANLHMMSNFRIKVINPCDKAALIYMDKNGIEMYRDVGCFPTIQKIFPKK